MIWLGDNLRAMPSIGPSGACDSVLDWSEEYAGAYNMHGGAPFWAAALKTVGRLGPGSLSKPQHELWEIVTKCHIGFRISLSTIPTERPRKDTYDKRPADPFRGPICTL